MNALYCWQDVEALQAHMEKQSAEDKDSKTSEDVPDTQAPQAKVTEAAQVETDGKSDQPHKEADGPVGR